MSPEILKEKRTRKGYCEVCNRPIYFWQRKHKTHKGGQAVHEDCYTKYLIWTNKTMKIKIVNLRKLPWWHFWTWIYRYEVTYELNNNLKKSILYETNSASLLLHYTHAKALGFKSQFSLSLEEDCMQIYQQLHNKFKTLEPSIKQLYGHEFKFTNPENEEKINGLS